MCPLLEVVVFSQARSPICRDSQEVQTPASLPFLHWNKTRRGTINDCVYAYTLPAEKTELHTTDYIKQKNQHGQEEKQSLEFGLAKVPCSWPDL